MHPRVDSHSAGLFNASFTNIYCFQIAHLFYQPCLVIRGITTSYIQDGIARRKSILEMEIELGWGEGMRGGPAMIAVPIFIVEGGNLRLIFFGLMGPMRPI